MTHDPHGPIEPRPTDGEPSSGDAAAWSRIPPSLRNWQVVEIDGEATLVDARGAALKSAPDPAATSLSVPAHPPIADRSDEVIVLGLAPRRVELAAGDSTTFTVELLNNGPAAAYFDLTVEGWLPEAWFQEEDARSWPLRLQLQPGERRAITLTLTLPQRPMPPAGEHPFAVVAHADRYPARRARVGAVVAVAAQYAFAVGALQPNRATTGWLRRRAVLHVPVSNRGNVPAALIVMGLDRDRELDIVFHPTAAEEAADDPAAAFDADDWTFAAQPGVARLQLAPGETRLLTVTVQPRRRPLLALTPWVTPMRVVVRAEADPAALRASAQARRVAEGQVVVQPLLGPWHLLAGAMAGVVAFFGLGLAGLALLLALRNATVPVAPAPVVTPETPSIAFVIQLEQPAQTRSPSAPAPSIAYPSAPVEATPAVPVVRADQITAPGEPTPVGQVPLQPVIAPPVVANSALRPNPAPRADSDGMTYAQMFQEIGLIYDLDWRLLAAVAYVESGFDSLALSGEGDMGLMQIRATTWREWAPVVAASDPFDSYSNVLVAARYLDYLRTLLSERGYPQTEWMLIAYNWGPEPVLSHLDAGGTLATLAAERRLYAEDVLRIALSIPAH